MISSLGHRCSPDGVRAVVIRNLIQWICKRKLKVDNIWWIGLMVAFVITNAAVAVSLTISLLPGIMNIQGVAWFNGLWPQWKDMSVRLNRSKLGYSYKLSKFFMRIREIDSPWCIKPSSIQWFNLFIYFVPYDDPERFKPFICVSPTTFHAICEMVHHKMVTNPPWAFCTLPNIALSCETRAISLRKLSTGKQFLGIGKLFGVSCPTVAR